MNISHGLFRNICVLTPFHFSLKLITEANIGENIGHIVFLKNTCFCLMCSIFLCGKKTKPFRVSGRALYFMLIRILNMQCSVVSCCQSCFFDCFGECRVPMANARHIFCRCAEFHRCYRLHDHISSTCRNHVNP